MDLKIATSLPKVKISPEVSRSRNSLLEIVLLLVVAGLFYWFVAMPKADDVKAKQTKLDSLTSQQASVQSDFDTLKALSQKLNDSKADIAHLDEALPLNERAVRLQMLAQSLAQSTGVVVGDISVDSTGDSAGNMALLADPYGQNRSLQTITFNISVSGTISQLETLLQKIENYGRIMDISSLSLSLNKDNILDMRLSLNAYYYGPQTQSPSANGAPTMAPIH